jgi:hypothetical protein
MTNVKVTNGVIKYGRSIKTGDFESKRGDVELSFTIAEGADADEAIAAVEGMAIKHVFDILGHQEDSARKAAPKAEAAGKAPKPPKATAAATTKAADASDVEEPPAPKFIEKEVAAKAAAAPAEENLDDLLCMEPTKEITDKELTDATQKCQAAVKNAPAIRKLVADMGVKMPPGRIIDIPQDKRQEYLDKLKEVKPLA